MFSKVSHVHHQCIPSPPMDRMRDKFNACCAINDLITLPFGNDLTEWWFRFFKCACCLALKPQGKRRWKASPHGQKGKALCDVWTFAAREATRMTQDKHFHYESKAEQMQSGQTLGLEESWHGISVWEYEPRQNGPVNGEHVTEATPAFIPTWI